jgi:chloramphenicol O-acetyltransferase type B
MLGFAQSIAGRVVARLRGRNSVFADLAERFPQYNIGPRSYGDSVTVVDFGEGSTLNVGAYSSFAAGVTILLGGEHRIDWVTTFPFSALDKRFEYITGHPRTRGDVNIGSDVWLGRDALVLSGVTIGDGAVVGARSVVRKDVPAYAIVAGSPATIVRYRFSPQIIERLLAVAWWRWPTARIERAIPHLLNPDIEAFLDAAEAGEL